MATIKANRQAGESQEVLARNLTTLFHKLFDLSRPPADQVPDMVESISEVIYDYLDERFPEGALPGGKQLFADDHLDAEFKHEAGCDELAERILAALQAVPAASEVDRLPENYELSHGPLNGDMSDCAWQVHSIHGGYNDREWTLVATGKTPSEAIIAALKASGEE